MRRPRPKPRWPGERRTTFARRVKRGDFAKLLDAATSKVLTQAATDRSYQLELGALRFAIARTISEEADAHKMSLAIARLANAVSRLAIAEYGRAIPNRSSSTAPSGSRPCPAAKSWSITSGATARPTSRSATWPGSTSRTPCPGNIDQQVETDYRDSLSPDRQNRAERQIPPPAAAAVAAQAG